MFKSTKNLITGALVIFASTIAATFALNTTVNLNVTGGSVTPGSTGSFNFGSFQVASSQITTGKQFTGTDYFFVDDLKGADSGWYTTISVTDLTGTAGTISSGNIAMKVDTTTTTLITGTANTNVVVSNTLTSYTALSTVQTFIKRDAGANNGKLGVYAAFPWLQITIPAYQAVGSYQAILTYTLIEN